MEVIQFIESDLPFGKRLTDIEGWHRAVTDWRRLLAIEPQGVFKARISGSDAGIAAVVNYSTVAWIHSVIVAEQFRKKGVGTVLMQACLDYIRSLGTKSVKLDAVPNARGFYEMLGFSYEFDSLRLVGEGNHCSDAAERMTLADLDQVISFDTRITGFDRTKTIRRIYEDNPGWAFIARSQTEVVGYVLAREDDVRVNLGPCVCQPGDSRCALRLIRSVLGVAPERSYRICVPEHSSIAPDLTNLGFERSSPSFRMSLGTRFMESEGCFTMISPEKG